MTTTTNFKQLKNQLKFTILERFDFLIMIHENDYSNDNDDDDCDDDDDCVDDNITMTSTMKTMTTKDLKDHLEKNHSQL